MPVNSTGSKMQNTHHYIITRHARERFVERFSRESVKFAHLSNCRRGGDCDECRNLTFTLSELVEANKNGWDRIIRAKIHEAEDIKVIQNNINFMEYVYRKHGYHNRFSFLVEGRILFLVITDNGRPHVITCMDVNYPVNGTTIIADFIHRPKFKKKKIEVGAYE